MLKGTWCRWHLGGERPVPTGGKGSLLFRESGSTDDILSNPYLSAQEQQFWCALRGERCLPLPRSITLQVSHGWCETHPCRQSPFPPVMKRSSQAARLITTDNAEWKSVELPASNHSVISRMCPKRSWDSIVGHQRRGLHVSHFPFEVYWSHFTARVLCWALQPSSLHSDGMLSQYTDFFIYFCLKGWAQRFLLNCTVFKEPPGQARRALSSPHVIFVRSRR